MRVLAVGNMYPPHHLGGYELVWRAAMKHLQAVGHEVRILTSDVRFPGVDALDPPEVSRSLRWYWRDHEFPRMSLRERLALERTNARVFDGELEAFRPDVVSWWAMGGMSLALIERAHRAGIPAVGFVSDDWLVYAPLVDGWARAGRKLGPLARALGGIVGLPLRVDFSVPRWMFVSEFTRQAALTAHDSLPNTGIAHTGIGPMGPPAPPREWAWELLYLGRIDPRKGIDTAIDAIAMLPEARLTLVGGGDEQHAAQLRAHADARGVAERMRFEPQRDRADLPGIIAASDTVLFPVRWNEPWGLVPIEAMACGRPVIATGRGGSAEFLRDGQNCLLFRAEDPSALAAAIGRLATDEDLRARLREGGLRTAAVHTEAAFNVAVEAALLEAVAPPSRG